MAVELSQEQSIPLVSCYLLSYTLLVMNRLQYMTVLLCVSWSLVFVYMLSSQSQGRILIHLCGKNETYTRKNTIKNKIEMK